MAITVERMVAVLEARMDKYDKALARAAKNTDKTFGGMEARGKRFSDSINTTVGRSGRGFDQVGRNVNALRGQTANLAAQFQDIGVQLQSGTSPFTVALQQGTQINQVLGPLGVRGAVSALGGAFASLINPISLLTIGTIALGGAAVQYFSSVLSEGEQSNETVAKQRDLIRQVSAEWGEAIPALKAYVDELDRLESAERRNEAVQQRVNELFADFRAQLPDLGAGIADLSGLLESYGGQSAQVDTLRDSFDTLSEKIKDGTAEADDLAAVQEVLAGILESTGIPAAQEMADVVNGMADAFARAAGQANRLTQQNAIAGLDSDALAPLNPLNGFRSTPFQNEAELMDERARNTRSQYQIEQDRLSRSGGRSASISDVERERQAVADLIETMEFELALIGASDLERERANALRRAGSAATDEQREDILGLVDALYQEKEALEQNAQVAAFFDSAISSAFDDLVPKIETGNRALDNLVNSLIKAVAQAALLGQGPLASLFGGSGGGLLNGLFNLGGPGQIQLARGSVGLFDRGGYTGSGGRMDPAGIVHRGEYVFDQDSVRAAGGPGVLDALRGRLKGYASGGYVGSMPSVPMVSRGGGSQAPVVNIIDNAGVQKRTSRERGPNGEQLVNVVLERVKEDVSQGGFDGPFGGRFGASPVRIRRGGGS